MVIICQSKLWLDFPWGKCGSLVGLLFSVFEVILGITADAKYLISTVFFFFLKHMLLLLLGTRHNLDLKCFR